MNVNSICTSALKEGGTPYCTGGRPGKAGVIAAVDMDVFMAMVALRNNFSHRTSAAIRSRHEAISQLRYIAELLNRLFK